jgi:hypothetical protein
MTRKAIHILVVVALLFGAATFAPTAQATQFWRFITYYDGCGANMTVVGTATRDCSGNWTYSGQQSGHWKDVNDVSCTGGPLEYEYVYEYCGGSWVQISLNDLGACSC